MNTPASPNSVLRGAVLIVGAGIGGIQSALDLANSGFKVHLVQKDSAVGGTMVMLDKTFPTGDCAMCMISPKMVNIGRHPNIQIHTLAEVAAVSGHPGDFKVQIRQQARFVKPEKCTGCGVCEQKCPQKVVSEYEQGLAKRKAIYALFAQAVPNTRVIDREHCIFFKKGTCKACQKFCDAGAIDFDDQDKTFELDVGAVILCPGLRRYDPRLRQELGFGRWPNVVTSVQFERILSASGPFQGAIRRPSDGQHPRRLAWIQCVGSRDAHNANPWCSSVCCMYATKQAVIAREHDARIESTIFFMEMRAFGKDFDKYIDRAQKTYGVRYQRAMISAVREEPGSGNLILRYAAESGALVDETFDLVILSVGLEPHLAAREFADRFGIQPNAHGFARTGPFNPVETTRPGIFVTGTYQGPKDIAETVMQGSAVAGRVMAMLSAARGTEVLTPALPPETDVSGQEPRLGVYVCHCGINIAQSVDIQQVVDKVKDLPNVVHAENFLYACSQDSQEKIRNLIQTKGLNRIIVASCTPRTHEPLFQETIRAAGLNKYLFDLADIREQCSWCHMGQKEAATEKAIDIVKMSIAKARRLNPVKTESVNVTPAAMILGGGIAGMTAALSLAAQGFQVHIVEKTARLGGLALQVYRTLEGGDVQAFVRGLAVAVENHRRIDVHLDAEVQRCEGFVGNFSTTLTNGTRFDHGVVVVAIGGIEYEPDEYGFGASEQVITQRQLEKMLAEGPPGSSRHYVMIQCVGSREEPHNYCSRVCCQDAVKNAIAVKTQTPESHVTILFRDIRTYGLREDYYQQARDLGVRFIRFHPDRKPEVNITDDGIRVKTHDDLLDRDILLNPDYVVLSAGLRPHPAADKIAKLYKLTRNPEGYFLEAHVKLQPVDFPSEGIFLAGLAHAPKNLDETVSQALAAAGRAGVLLPHDRLSVSGIISKHNPEACVSCLNCLMICPFDSPYVNAKGRVAHNEIKCMGCGICASICPAKAFQVNSFKDEQIMAMIDALTENLAPV